MINVLLGDGAREGGLTESSLDDFYGRLRSFRESLELDLSGWPLEEEKEVARPEVHWFLSQQENQDLMRDGLQQLAEFRQTLIKCSHQSIGATD